MKLLIQVLTFLLLSLSTQLKAQVKITGQVNDSKSATPLSGATITNKKTGAQTLAAPNGSFGIIALPGDELEITMTGYNREIVKLAKQLTLNIEMRAAITTMNDVVMVGTRTQGRIKTETPVPVDVLNVGEMKVTTARNDITSLLNYAAPSFNYNKQTGSDGADHIDLATLRGLGPDQTLVMINGKRRHQTAFVAVFGTRGRGNSGTDLSAIPAAAIDRVEILRDGASAQYGSDAIAGVINLVLKKNTGTFTGDVGYSAYYDKKYNPFFKKEIGQYIYDKGLDGNAITINGNYGASIGKNGGFINLTGNVIKQDKTYRQAMDTDPNSADFMYNNIYRRAHGDGSMNNGGVFMNMEIPINNSRTSFYSFGGYNYKSSDAFAFTRNWSARPDRFPTNVDGSMIYIKDIMMPTADGDTFYNPHIQSKIADYSIAAGLKGVIGHNWNWDVSNVLGSNNFHYFGDKTFNASKGAGQTHFDDGGFSHTENTINLGLSKEVSSTLHLAFGTEYRLQNYKLFAGEEASYKNYDTTGVKATGAQGFPGFQPTDEANASRSIIGAYADVEWDVSKNFLLDGAIRYEHYSDFGSTFNSKLAGRLKVGDNFNFRGSISSGFRAPSLQQINFSSTFTTIQGSELAEVKIAPNYSPITKAAGIDALEQERSMNASIGFNCKPTPNLTISVDAYNVKIWDRVVLSGQFSADDNSLNPILLNAMHDLKVSYAQFFANAVNTTNKGIDIVIDYNKKLGKNKNIRALFTGNFQGMNIDNINVPSVLNDTKDHRETFLSDREKYFILASAPKTKFAFNVEYGINKLTIGSRLTYFGKISILGFGQDGLGINPQVPSDADENVLVPDQYNYSGKLVTDLYFNYKINKTWKVSWGADNLLNVHPDLGINPLARGWAFNNETGGPWDAVQMGGNGIRLFARVGLTF